MPTPQKIAVVQALSADLEKANAIYLADYSGMNVEALTSLRRNLREVDAEFRVVKNNLIRLSLKDTQWASAGEDLAGPTAITLGYGEAPAAAKVLNNFAKKNAQKPVVKKIGFEEDVFEGDFLEKLASMPTRDEALASLAGTLNSIIGGFARVINAVKEKAEEAGVDTPAALAGAKSEEVATEAPAAPEAEKADTDDAAPKKEEESAE
jgi:large subunit ribosomal protein L10